MQWWVCRIWVRLITCSSCEMSAAGEHGMNIYLDKVPLRQDMEACNLVRISRADACCCGKGKEQVVLDICLKNGISNVKSW